MIWLSKGGKYVAFDLHRQFLPPDHPDREDKKNFTKGRVVHEVTEIPTFSGADVLAQLKALKPKVKGKGKAKAYYIIILPLFFYFQRGYGTTERSEFILTEVNG